MTTNTQMLPCPFCNQQDAFVEQLDSDASVVICQGRVGEHEACLCRGPVGVQQSDEEDQPGHGEAVRLWNLRAAPAEDVRAMVDEPAVTVELKDSCLYLVEGQLSPGRHVLYRHPAPLCSEVAPQCSEQVRTQGQRKVVMPELLDNDDSRSEGWGACLDEIKRLNGDQS